MEEIDKLIKFYFHLGLHKSEILCVLALKHDIFISESTVKRKLNAMKLYRRKYFTDPARILEYLENEVITSAQLNGYKWMHLKCLQNKFVVTQNTVRQLLHFADPLGIEIRKRRRLRRRFYRNKGPNLLWHMDCYDKLKPYGICISGCIDGFSRHIMWLRAGKNTNNPKIIAGFFMSTIEALHGCPRRVRADLGTENTIVEKLQSFLRATDNVEESSDLPFLYGTSPNNQRIEAWWSILRKHQSQFWMNFFQDLKEDGNFSGSFLDKSLIQFCFVRIIQDELDTVQTEWNLHSISASRNSIAPCGRPFMMYHTPEIYGTKDYLCAVNTEAIDACKEICAFPDTPCDKDVFELANIILRENNLTMATEPYSALDLYVFLRNSIVDML